MENFNKRGAFSEIFLPLPITYGAVSLATKEFIKVVHGSMPWEVALFILQHSNGSGILDGYSSSKD